MGGGPLEDSVTGVPVGSGGDEWRVTARELGNLHQNVAFVTVMLVHVASPGK